jgi:hypothetical protein
VAGGPTSHGVLSAALTAGMPNAPQLRQEAAERVSGLGNINCSDAGHFGIARNRGIPERMDSLRRRTRADGRRPGRRIRRRQHSLLEPLQIAASELPARQPVVPWRVCRSLGGQQLKADGLI